MSAYIQGTPEWLESRRNKIGSSDAPVIAGVSPYQTRHGLWMEKMGFGEPVRENPAMRRGKLGEQIVRDYYCILQDIEMYPVVVNSDTFPWMMASFDGLNPERTRAIEIKVVGKDAYEEAEIGRVPEHHRLQMIHQMGVLCLPSMDYVAAQVDLERGRVTNISIVPVKFDDDIFYWLSSLEREYWSKHIIGGLEPELTDKDYVTREDEEWEIAAAHYKNVKLLAEEAARQESMAKSHLIELAGGRSVKGAGVNVRRGVRRGSVDYRDIPLVKQMSDADLDHYRKESIETWTVRVR